MSIEIYSKAKVIKKDNKYYYFLKYHSKNDCICGGQYIVDGDFKTKFIRRNSRAGSWSIKAIGGEKEYNKQAIQKTDWNAPKFYVYGEIQFGNKKNIALYWAKSKAIDFYSFDTEQQGNIQKSIDWAEGKGKEYVINLSDIQENNKMKLEHEYCGEKYNIMENNICKEYYNDKIYWSVDVL